MAEDRPSSSGLEFQLHPLVLINVSDHWTRAQAAAGGGPAGGSSAAAAAPPPCVVGCLLGQQSGRTVDISNSFELLLEAAPGGPALHAALLAQRAEQYKQTFPALDVVGWYVAGAGVGDPAGPPGQPGDAELRLHRQVMALNEAPVLLWLDPAAAAAGGGGGGDLPVRLFEGELQPAAGDAAPALRFAAAGYAVRSSEAERIGVDQVAKLLPTGASAAGDQLAAHLGALGDAAAVLVGRLEGCAAVLARVEAGELALPPAAARQVVALARALPAGDAPELGADAWRERADALVAVLLAQLTAGAEAAASLADRHAAAFGDRPVGGGGGGGGGGKRGKGFGALL